MSIELKNFADAILFTGGVSLSKDRLDNPEEQRSQFRAHVKDKLRGLNEEMIDAAMQVYDENQGKFKALEGKKK